jgi:Tol biopolymer transport system component
VLWSSDRSGHFEIWMASADGSGARQVSNDGFDAENPAMTPDGAWVVYASGHADKRGLWKVRPDGTDATMLAGGPRTLPEISPDGRFVSTNLDSDAARLIEVVRIADGAKVPFVITIDADARFGDANVGRHRWMPDGRAIAFFAGDAEGVAGIFAQDFAPGQDTTATRRRLAGFFRDVRTESFGISPDGSGVIISGVEASSDVLVARGLAGVAPPVRRAAGKQ